MRRSALVLIATGLGLFGQSHERDFWNGIWIFDQAYEVSENTHLADGGELRYKLKVKRQGTKYKVLFEATSSLHATWIEALGYQHGKQLKVVFQKYQIAGGSNLPRFGVPMAHDLKRGDIMFTLSNEGDHVTTRWEKVKPKSEDEFEPGRYFEFRGSSE